MICSNPGLASGRSHLDQRCGVTVRGAAGSCMHTCSAASSRRFVEHNKAQYWYIAAVTKLPACELMKGYVAIGDPAVPIYARTVRKCALLLVILMYMLVGSLAFCGEARAGDAPQLATATTQDLLEPIPGLSVVWHGKRVSALPFRIRLLNQASP